jgi:glycerol transport system ATP-binding protein
MVYVTHDQTEALTFADQVAVMKDGDIVQVGTPIELFEKPRHTFVGHFIGSPGMNVLPCEVRGGKAIFAGEPVETANAAAWRGNGKALELGVRPEFINFAASGIGADVVKVTDVGRYRIVETDRNGARIKVLVPEGQPVPSGHAFLQFDPAHSQIYEDGWMVS